MTVYVTDPHTTDVSSYGKVIGAWGVEPDADEEDFRFWDRLATIELGSCSVGLVRAFPQARMHCPLLERHGESSETLIPIEDEIVVVCALSAEDEVETPDLSTVKAILVRRAEALVLEAGVWHYAPMTRRVEVQTFVLFKNETLQNDLLKVEGLDIQIEE
jgi:ureidoglycolate hydrolase